MPRDGAGTYTLPAGNPVVSGTTIAVTWANTTLNDVATQLNNVLTRDGLLGPTATFKILPGSAASPGLGFTNDLTTGFYRAAAGQVALALSGVNYATLSPVNNVFVAPLQAPSLNLTGTIGIAATLVRSAYLGEFLRFVGTGGSSAGVGVTASDTLNFYTGGVSRFKYSQADGEGLLITAQGCVGYAPGTGGTVTQLTSKATAVTLNKATGQVSTSNSNLIAGNAVVFTVNNSVVQVGDTVIVHRASGGSNTAYFIDTGSVSAGAFEIVIINRSGGDLAESINIAFAIVRGATS